MEEDWGNSANAPSFSLFDAVSTPEEQAKLNTFVNPIIYNRWSKADRRRYQKLKLIAIKEKLKNDELKTVDDLSLALDSLNLMKTQTPENDHELDDMITQLNSFKLVKESADNTTKTN